MFNHKPASLDVIEENGSLVKRGIKRGFSYGLSPPGYSNVILVYVGKTIEDQEKAITVLLHELGHMYGLSDHKDTRKCIMGSSIKVKKSLQLLRGM